MSIGTTWNERLLALQLKGFEGMLQEARLYWPGRFPPYIKQPHVIELLSLLINYELSIGAITLNDYRTTMVMPWLRPKPLDAYMKRKPSRTG
jgi:hypothetical protein